MRDDILKLFSGHENLSHLFIATFNIDFIFIESVLLRQLRKCGHPSLTIFADADEVESTFASQGRWISQLGRRYRVLPIRMERGYRFHPKLVMLAGTEHGELFVGSGNLTLGGMRQNDELWLRFQSEADGTAPLSAFRDYAEACIRRAPYPKPALAELQDAFDPEQHAWARTMDSPLGVVAKVGEGPSLLQRLLDQVGVLDVERIIVGSPYFDEAGEALAAIASHWPTVPLEVLVQPQQSQLLESAWQRIREPKSLVNISTSREGAKAFVHAKFFAFVGATEAVVAIGSANCSRAALMIPGTAGNAEAMAVVRMAPGEVDALIASGLRRVDEPPALRDSLPPAEPSPAAPAIRILSARLDHGELVVVFLSVDGARLVELVLDDRVLSGSDVEASRGVAKARGIGAVSRVAVAAVVGDVRHVSSEHWVDHEGLLSASSRQRQAAEAVGGHVSPGQWSFGGWTEVLRLMGSHLSHTPVASLDQANRESAEKATARTVTAADFFTDDYRLPKQRQHGRNLDDAARILGLRSLLLDYFGVSVDTPEEQAGQVDRAEEDVVDRPEDVSIFDDKPPPQPERRDPTEAERRRGQKIVRQIVDTLASPEFIQKRPAALLSSDIAILAVLLISGHAEDWLKNPEFLELTYRVWSFLFIDDAAGGTKEKSVGALARRHELSPDRHEFEASMRSVRLAAALATWSFSCPKELAHAEATRFEVATRLAVARLPWLWCLDARGAVAQELFAIAERTGWLGPEVAANWDQVLVRWNDLFAEGRAIAILEGVLMDLGLSTLRANVKDGAVRAGTLLWQGTKLGFCSLAEDADRHAQGSRTVRVLTLRSENRDTNIQASYLLPFRSLVALGADCAGDRLGPAEVAVLLALSSRLESMWRKN